MRKKIKSKYSIQNIDVLYRNIENNSINIYITKLSNFKTEIPKPYFIKTDINKDRNCFYKSVSRFLSGNENYYKLIRKIVYNYILLNKEHINNNIGIYNDNYDNIYEYLNKLILDVTYSGELEIIYSIFNIENICI